MMSNPADEQAIRNVIQEWMVASQAGDTDKVLSLMSDDVLFMVPGREPFGKDAFRGQSDQMKDVRIEGKADVREVSTHGDWGWCRTSLEVSITPPGQATNTQKGYALTIFRKSESGQWQLYRDANLLAR